MARLNQLPAEVVSPYYGILINTDVGNPIVPVGMTPRFRQVPNGHVEDA